jgi:tRNA(Arg) A34 adenosine deaminase TadA
MHTQKKVQELRVALTVADLDRAVRFYRDGLGLDEVMSWANPDGRGFILAAGRATLELIDQAQAQLIDQVEVGERVAGPVRLAMEFADVGAAAEAGRAAGADLLHEPVVTPWRDRNARLVAPDGMQITLFQPLGGEEAPEPSDDEAAHLRAAIRLAAQARARGNHPFGALLVGPDGAVLAEAENTVVTERDVAGHAELNLVRQASQRLDRAALAGATLYTSTEPCAMCAGAIYWAGIGRVVFALSGASMRDLAAPNPSNDVLDLPCREVFARGPRAVAVAGPFLEDEARAVHAGFWA